MGIIIDALAITVGIFVGSIFKERLNLKNFTVLGISIMIISLVGFIENIFGIEKLTLKSDDLLVVVFALIIGAISGELLKIDLKLDRVLNQKNKAFSEFIDVSIFFGVGGMQICGPLLLATVGDNSQLILKSLIDFPFALMFGIRYGKKVALSALPVVAGQLVIVLLAILTKNFLDTHVIKQICAFGYIILFFSGFNLICEERYKIKNTNMLMGIIIIFLYNAVRLIWR